METGTDIWTYRDQAIGLVNLIGYSVEATTARSALAGVIDRVDQHEQKVHVNRTKGEIKNAPEYDPDLGIDETYRIEVGGYYSGRTSATRT